MGAHVSVPMYRRSLPQRLRMEAARCMSCRCIDFPPRGACSACGGKELEPVPLSGRGRVHAATMITSAGAPPEFAEQARRTRGYTVAIVALKEGPLITGQVVDAGAGVAIGDAVETVVRRLYEEEGVIRYGFKFRPSGSGDSAFESTESEGG